MAYLTYTEYAGFSGSNAVTEAEFNRLLFMAERQVEQATAGVDNVSKLKYATPTDESDMQAVKRAIGAVINVLYDVEVAQNAMKYTTDANGVRSGVISSVSAGNESISFATGNIGAIQSAASDRDEKAKLVYSTICEYLVGVTDKNGVNLLYVGSYPYRLEVDNNG